MKECVVKSIIKGKDENFYMTVELKGDFSIGKFTFPIKKTVYMGSKDPSGFFKKNQVIKLPEDKLF